MWIRTLGLVLAAALLGCAGWIWLCRQGDAPKRNPNADATTAQPKEVPAPPSNPNDSHDTASNQVEPAPQETTPSRDASAASGPADTGRDEFVIPPSEFDEGQVLKDPQKYFDSSAYMTALSHASGKILAGDERLLGDLIAFYNRSTGQQRLSAFEAIWYSEHPKAIDLVLAQYQDPSSSIRARFVDFAREVAQAPKNRRLPSHLRKYFNDPRSVRAIHEELLNRFEDPLKRIAENDAELGLRKIAAEVLTEMRTKRLLLRNGEDFGLADYKQ